MTELGNSRQWAEHGNDRIFYTVEDGDIVAYEADLEPEEPESINTEITLIPGVKWVISPEWFKILMHSPQITAQVEERCSVLAETANSMAVIDTADYTYYVSNNSENIRARGRVKTGNHAAREDNAAHSTLMKALASVGSDPLPESYGDWEGQGVLEDEPDLQSWTNENEVEEVLIEELEGE